MFPVPGPGADIQLFMELRHQYNKRSAADRMETLLSEHSFNLQKNMESLLIIKLY